MNERLKKANEKASIDPVLERIKFNMSELTDFDINITCILDRNSQLDALYSFVKKITVDGSFKIESADKTLASTAYTVLAHEYSHAINDNKFSVTSRIIMPLIIKRLTILRLSFLFLASTTKLL